MLNLMDFAMNTGGKRVTDLSDGLVCLKLQLALSLRHFDLVLKIEPGFRLAFFVIKDALFLEDFLCGQLLTGSIQTLMSLFRLLFKTLDFLRCGSCFISDRLFRCCISRLAENGFTIYGFDSLSATGRACNCGLHHDNARISRSSMMSFDNGG